MHPALLRLLTGGGYRKSANAQERALIGTSPQESETVTISLRCADHSETLCNRT